MLHYQDEQTKAYRILDLTSVTVDEFAQLVGPFDAAFVRHMRDWTLEGKPRTGRRYRQYASCPLPAPEDRVLFILSYLQVAALQVAHGALFGMTQSNANKWIHLLLPVLHQTLIDLGDVPARHRQALKQRLTALHPPPSDAVDAAAAAPPTLFCTMAPSARLRAPTIPLSKKRSIAARKSDTP